jgi:hypothetical protein
MCGCERLHQATCQILGLTAMTLNQQSLRCKPKAKRRFFVCWHLRARMPCFSFEECVAATPFFGSHGWQWLVGRMGFWLL